MSAPLQMALFENNMIGLKKKKIYNCSMLITFWLILVKKNIEYKGYSPVSSNIFRM